MNRWITKLKTVNKWIKFTDRKTNKKINCHPTKIKLPNFPLPPSLTPLQIKEVPKYFYFLKLNNSLFIKYQKREGNI